MRILIVKLSSMGDVVHTMPVVHDLRSQDPQAVVDWAVEPAFAPLVRRVQGVAEVIETPLRRWSQDWWHPDSWAAFKAWRQRLRQQPYDLVLDLQGLTKSALVARLAQGRRYGYAGPTEGSSFEAPARWVADVRVVIEPRRIHALDRGRQLAARAMALHAGKPAGVADAPVQGPPIFGLQARPVGSPANDAPLVVFAHGASRDDKRWPHDHWIALGKRVLAAGWRIALPQSSEAEQTRAEMIAAALQFERAPLVEVWPTLALDRIVDRLAACRGVIGVDSGLSHLAVALNLPHVQLYNQPTSWRTGPQPAHGHRHQISLEGQPVPTVESVWLAWQQVAPVGAAVTRPAQPSRPHGRGEVAALPASVPGRPLA